MTQIAPYGAWKSPISVEMVTAAGVGLGSLALDGQDVYYSELRPTEKGRIVIVRLTPDGRRLDLTPEPMNVRTRVHEYGGGAFTVADGVVYFVNFADQHLYRQIPGEAPALLCGDEGMRFADFAVDRARQRLICVREDHTGGGQPVNTVVAIPTGGSAAPGSDGGAHGADGGSGAHGATSSRVLVGGNDFYSSPRISPDGRRLAWLTWNHPNMPWDSTELWVGDLAADGSVAAAHRVAGGPGESIFQPEWSPDGRLYFVSDRTGWWNLYRLEESGGAAGGVAATGTAGGAQARAVNLAPMAAEFGQPQWSFGMSTYGFESADRIVCAYSQQGLTHLASLDLTTLQLSPIELPYTELSGIRVAPGRVYFAGGSPTLSPVFAAVDLATGVQTVLRQASDVAVDPRYLSPAQPVEFPTTGGLTAYGLFYPPQNGDFRAPDGERPPLIVKSHGGPTAAASSMLALGVQYWTSRGFAVLDVNYGGSSGYGRAYRERLNGNWGIVDVDDCVNGARYLADKGLVDGSRMSITGGSAGGYTTLAALTFHDVFRAGASFFGVSDLETLAADTHKFESRYLDRLVGPYPAAREVYRARSPIHHTAKLSCPLIFFQGLDDKVVPPNQAEAMVNVLREKGLPVAYIPFEGEGHGFRRAENNRRALEAQLYFYSRIYGFTPADAVEPVVIENLS